MNAIFLLLSIAQAEPTMDRAAALDARPQSTHVRPAAAPGERARKVNKLKRGKKARKGRKGRRGASSFAGPGHGPKGAAPQGHRGGDRYAECQADIREDRRDRKEDVRDRREDRVDAMHHGGRRDRQEDVRDRREDRRDRAEDRYDRNHGCSRR